MCRSVQACVEATEAETEAPEAGETESEQIDEEPGLTDTE
jgi:hypothetical protein